MLICARVWKKHVKLLKISIINLKNLHWGFLFCFIASLTEGINAPSILSHPILVHFLYMSIWHLETNWFYQSWAKHSIINGLFFCFAANLSWTRTIADLLWADIWICRNMDMLLQYFCEYASNGLSSFCSLQFCFCLLPSR